MLIISLRTKILAGHTGRERLSVHTGLSISDRSTALSPNAELELDAKRAKPYGLKPSPLGGFALSAQCFSAGRPAVSPVPGVAARADSTPFS